jgi:RNA polymerase sigma-70 factor (ECF subfamily)
MEDPKLKIKGAFEPSSSLRDEELIALFLEGERSRFRELVERYDQKLLNFINRIIGDRERSEDLVQETFIRVYKHLGRFDREKKFSTWVYTIASNLAKNELRNRTRNPIVLLENLVQDWDDDHRPLEFADSSNRPDDLFMKRHLRETVEKAVEKLPAHHRLVFILRETEGKSYEEIAEITGCSLGTVKSRLNRARNNFAAIVAPMLEMELPQATEDEGNREDGEG